MPINGFATQVFNFELKIKFDPLGPLEPIFPDEELDEVKVLRQGREEESPVHGISVHGIRTIAKAESGQLPKGHGESAVDEALQIQAKDAWVQFGSPDKILEKTSRASRILGGWEMDSFECQEDAKEQAENVQKGKSSREDIVHDSKIIKVKVTNIGSGIEQCSVDKAVQNSVVDVFWNVTREGFGSAFNLSGQNSFQDEGDSHERQDKLDSFESGHDRKSLGSNSLNTFHGVAHACGQHDRKRTGGSARKLGSHFFAGQIGQQQRQERRGDN